MERMFALINFAKLKKFEKKVFSRVNAVLSVSENEAAVARSQAKGDVRVVVVPNGVDEIFLNTLDVSQNKNSRIVLCASMKVRRNIEAAIWFANDIFPAIKKQVSDAEFWIVGLEPPRKIKRLALSDGIKVIGTVEDIKEYYRNGRVFVAPYHFGAGTKLKVLEAMASGIPVVSTFVGCRGIEVSDKKNIIIADNVDDFSQGVIGLLLNKDVAKKISFAAKELIKEKYLWGRITENLESELLKIVNK